MSILVSDVLDFLVSKSAAPSTFGAQLDRLKYGVHVAPDPFRAREEAENHLLQQAALLRCIDDFAKRDVFHSQTRQRTGIVGSFKMLSKFQQVANRGQGEIALGILRAYQEWCTQSQERGLAAVYNFLVGIAPSVAPPLPKGDLLQAFREGTAKRARAAACEAYADSLLALQYHVRVWNKRS